MSQYNDNSPPPPPPPYLSNFWSLVTMKRLPATVEDIRTLVQVEMMKHYTRAPICRMGNNQIEKYITRLFVKDTNYFCNRSKYLVKDPDIRAIIDNIISESLQWHVETNLEGTNYLFASWQHWNM